MCVMSDGQNKLLSRPRLRKPTAAAAAGACNGCLRVNELGFKIVVHRKCNRIELECHVKHWSALLPRSPHLSGMWPV
jgi:hypothetical protein